MIVYKFRKTDKVYDGEIEMPDSPTIPKFHTREAPPQQEGHYAVMKNGWVLVAGEKPPEPVADTTGLFAAQQIQNRAKAYAVESDPLFFKAQRGEATQEEWLAKIAEIKQRFPKE
jgi:hypothetical protein